MGLFKRGNTPKLVFFLLLAALLLLGTNLPLVMIQKESVASSSDESILTPNVVPRNRSKEDPVDESLDQEDPILINIIQQKYLERPPPPGPLKLTMVSSLSHPMLSGQFGQASRMETFFQGMGPGFFLECGAADGETLSNTLLLEMKHNWTGVLIEANPATYKGIRPRHRNVFSLNVCLSPSAHPATLSFNVVEDNLRSALGEGKGAVLAQCLPLYSILLALGNPTVHYLSLDVEGAEQAVLDSVPWQKVDVKVLTVESSHSSSNGIEAVMKKGGYTMEFKLGEDLVFVKNGYKP